MKRSMIIAKSFLYCSSMLLATTLLLSCDEKVTTAIHVSKSVPAVKTLALTATASGFPIHTFGTFESAEKVTISVDSSDLVSNVHFHAGQQVKAGQTLIEFNQQKQKLRLNQAIADVKSAKAQLEKASSTFTRHRSLMAKKLISREQFKQSEADFESAKARLQQMAAVESLARQELAETTIISPVDGIVDTRNVEAGQTVLPGTTLGVILVTDTLRVVTYVTEKEVNSLHIGQVAPIVTPGVPGKTYEGRIELISSSADPRTGNFTVKLTVNNSDGLLREGMSARSALTITEENAQIAIPRNAIVDRNRRKVVYILKDNKAVEVEPVFGISDGSAIPIMAGLNAGDLLILDKLDLLIDGKAVLPAPTTANSDGATP